MPEAVFYCFRRALAACVPQGRLTPALQPGRSSQAEKSKNRLGSSGAYVVISSLRALKAVRTEVQRASLI